MIQDDYWISSLHVSFLGKKKEEVGGRAKQSNAHLSQAPLKKLPRRPHSSPYSCFSLVATISKARQETQFFRWAYFLLE